MSLAKKLLANLINVAQESNGNLEIEGYIVIDDKRVVTVPDSLKRLGVQHDHNIETVTFDAPRYWDGHDMSTMKLYVNYLTYNGIKGKCLTTNLKASYDRMTFDWVISGNVTQAKGKISFLVCAIETDADGIEKLHWNSELNQECYISEGLECEDIALVQYPDIITQLLLRMDAVEAIASPEVLQSYTTEWLEANHDRLLAEIELKASDVLASIPEDYIDTSRMAKEAVDTKADAIVLSASGNPVVISGSANAPLRGLRFLGKTTQVTTTGKNLFYPEAMLPMGFVADVSAGAPLPGGSDSGASITWSIGHDEEYRLIRIPVTQGEVYTFSRGAVIGSELRYAFATKDPKVSADAGSLSVSDNSEYKSALSFTTEPVPEGYQYLLVHLTSQNTIDNVESTWYQIERGMTATEYEPYSGGVASPSPEWTQEMIPISNPTVIVRGPEMQAKTATFGVGILNGFEVKTGGNYTDENGQEWFCDELDFNSRKVLTRIATLVLDGTEEIQMEEIGFSKRFVIKPADIRRGLSLVAGLCTSFEYGPEPVGLNNKDRTIYVDTDRVCLRWDDISSVSNLRDRLYNMFRNNKPVAIRYPLEIPIESDMPAPAYEAYTGLQTYYPETTVSSPDGNPIIVSYNADTKNYFDNRPVNETQLNAAVAEYFRNNPVSGETLIDTTTGKPYKLAVVNGKLTLIALEV